jgi:hypothetical protein
MLGCANTRRAPRRLSLAAALGAAALGAAAILAAATASQARPAALAKPSPPAVQPRSGHPFIPVQGDWEGTANGFAASFNLVLDMMARQRAGVPQYGIQDLVTLRPVSCPPAPAHHAESIVGGRLPSPLGGHGSLGLARFGLQGSITGARSATLSGTYPLRGCRPTITWHMHPAKRRTVAAGTWTINWAGTEHSTFRIQAGDRARSTCSSVLAAGQPPARPGSR